MSLSIRSLLVLLTSLPGCQSDSSSSRPENNSENNRDRFDAGDANLDAFQSDVHTEIPDGGFPEVGQPNEGEGVGEGEGEGEGAVVPQPLCQLGKNLKFYFGPEETKGIGECKEGLMTCMDVDGKPMFVVTRQEGTPSEELCDGLDNDCDRETDEEVADQIFYTGPDITLGVGPCHSGTRSCLGGAFEIIQDEVVPQPEVIDGVDNNCDGIMDTDLWLQVSTGAFHNCGIRADNTVECWGLNDYGQSTPLGGIFSQMGAGLWHTCGTRMDGTIECWGIADGSGRDHGQSSPPGENFSQISVGQNHTCGVKMDQTVACWGFNLFGQSVPPGGLFIQVDAGDDDTCGIRTDGTIECWGAGLGMVGIPAGTFFQISAGSSHNCGIKTDNTVTCWGNNADDRATPPAGTFSAVSAGREHTCGVMTNGAVTCWGSNEFGQTASPAGTFLHVGAGQFHSCAVRTDNTIACWGSNSNGQSIPP